MTMQANVQNETVVSQELAEILSAVITNDCCFDGESYDNRLFDRINLFLNGDAPVSEKLLAMGKLGQVLCTGQEVYNEAQLDEYLEFAAL